MTTKEMEDDKKKWKTSKSKLKLTKLIFNHEQNNFFVTLPTHLGPPTQKVKSNKLKKLNFWTSTSSRKTSKNVQ